MGFMSCRSIFTKHSAEQSMKVLGNLPREKLGFHRQLSSSMAHSSPVKLAYASYESAAGSSAAKAGAAPIIIIHGLFGSKNNWNSLSKAIHQRTNPVDARNHGDSPHTSESTYSDMMEDVVLLVKDLGIEKAVMVGHSMGGRVMMFLALNHPELVDKLVTIDISPVSSSSSLLSMTSIFEAMKNVTLEQNVTLSKARKTTDQQLSTTIKSTAVRQFLLTNLVEAEAGKYKWRVNLPVLEKNFKTHLTKFPATTSQFMGPTLFIGGSQSDYINVDDHDKIKKMFPAAKIQYISGAGHWVHSEKSQEFLDLITSFINEVQ
ncbi:protein ABHD11 isoform X2 [Athalia rosae]|uniref:protein ABHD11 isoform X2 n=1 Tax=Athalia rosae TaxID=37344 RepID=UPI0020347CC9|nr:protein ABHD11 isoform X2 [Athalia rosae]